MNTKLKYDYETKILLRNSKTTMELKSNYEAQIQLQKSIQSQKNIQLQKNTQLQKSIQWKTPRFEDKFVRKCFL